jgi:hypothetical protein
MNKNLANAGFDIGLIYNITDLLCDVKGAATIGRKAKLLLMNHQVLLCGSLSENAVIEFNQMIK